MKDNAETKMSDAEFDRAVAELKEKRRFDFADLCRLAEVLRHPRGCPWDREQTHKSIRKNMLEEAYEAAEAIDSGDPASLCEELGDVLLQVVLHSSIAKDEGAFDIGGVCTALCTKLIERHPHVFGDISVGGADEVLRNWDSIKQRQRGVKTAAESMEGISKALPELVRAQKIGQKAAKQNFDFKDAFEALEKAEEEIGEMKEALSEGEPAHIEEEAGDLLLAVVNAARLAGADAEEALHRANAKFCRRFAAVEKYASDSGLPLRERTGKEMLLLWEKAKNCG